MTRRLTRASLPTKILIFFGSGLLTFLFFAWLFDARASLLLVIAVALHEVGHWYAYHRFGYKSTLVFFPGLGAGTINNDEDAHENISYYQDAIVALAGPVTNIGLGLIGLLVSLNPTWHDVGMIFAGLNFLLAFLNLLPLSLLDGGHVMKDIYASIDSANDKVVAKQLFWVIALILAASIMFGDTSFFLILAIFGISKKSRLNPDAHTTPRAMPRDTALGLFQLLVVLLVFSWVLTFLLPDWSTI